MVLFDFEAPGLASVWEMARGGEATRGPGHTGSGLAVAPVAGSRIGTDHVPADWRGFGEVRFMARADAGTAFEIRVVGGEPGAAWWRKVEVSADGWQEVRVPLAWMRRAEGPAPSWAAIRGLSFAFRDSTRVWIDDVAVVSGRPERTPEMVAAVTGGVVTSGRHAAVVTQVPSLDARKLVADLDAVGDLVLRDLPFLHAPPVAVSLVVFPDVASYHAGVVGIGAAFGARAPTPTTDGFTIADIAMSSWDPGVGTDRPVFVHEFVHALLDQIAGLPNRGEWLQEGLASWYQIRRHPQANLGEVIRGQLARPTPLARLCDGTDIPTTLYGDAWAVVGTLLEEPRWAGTMPALFEATRRTGSTALSAIGADLDALEADRRVWAARHFGW